MSGVELWEISLFYQRSLASQTKTHISWAFSLPQCANLPVTLGCHVHSHQSITWDAVTTYSRDMRWMSSWPGVCYSGLGLKKPLFTERIALLSYCPSCVSLCYIEIILFSNTIKYKIWETDYSNTTFAIVNCNSCSSLLLIIVNLFLCLIHELNVNIAIFSENIKKNKVMEKELVHNFAERWGPEDG